MKNLAIMTKQGQQHHSQSTDVDSHRHSAQAVNHNPRKEKISNWTNGEGKEENLFMLQRWELLGLSRLCIVSTLFELWSSINHHLRKSPPPPSTTSRPKSKRSMGILIFHHIQ